MLYVFDRGVFLCAVDYEVLSANAVGRGTIEILFIIIRV